MNIGKIVRAAFVALHCCHHNFGIRRCDCEPDLSHQHRQTIAAFFPCSTAVGTLENTANIFAVGRGNTVCETPWRTAPPIKRRVNYFRIIGRHRNIDATHACALRRGCSQDGFPRFSRVRCFEQTAVAPVRPKIPESGNIRRFGTFRVNKHASYGATVLQPNVLPRAPAIARTINAIPPLRRITVGWFARPNPHNIGIARGDRDRADRLHRLLVEDRIEGYTVVARLEQTAG